MPAPASPEPGAGRVLLTAADGYIADGAGLSPFATDYPAVGNLAPELEGTDVNGRTVRLSDYRGQVVLVDFWATWCPPCRALIPYEKKLRRKYKGN